MEEMLQQQTQADHLKREQPHEELTRRSYRLKHKVAVQMFRWYVRIHVNIRKSQVLMKYELNK